MTTFDKLAIRINQTSRNFLVLFIFWYVCFLFFYFLTGQEQIFRTHLNLLDQDDLYVIILILSGTVALLFTLLDVLFAAPILRLLPRRLTLALKSLIYLAIAFLLLLAAADPLPALEQGNYQAALQKFPRVDIHLIRFVVYFSLATFLIHFFKAVMRKVGRGHFRSWLLGMLNKPIEQQRIFMFIDMKASTSIAEKLDHKKFSRLIQEVFNDLEVIDNYQGEIYQYLGDGAIISWGLREGLADGHFLKAFYAFRRAIHRRRRYYRRRYGIEPQFKAGAHAGKVMMLQVGQIRRDISYNGDTINTAARIESKCNELKQELLISENLYNMLNHKKGFSFKSAGQVQLEGKRRSVGIYQVKKKK